MLDELLSRQVHTLADMNTLYDDLISTLTKSATHNIPQSSYNAHTRPGWTKDVQHLNTKEREMRRIWLAEGRPRGMIFESYRNYKRTETLYSCARQRI